MNKIAGLLALALGASAAPVAKADISWLTDSKAAIAKAKALHELVMVDVSATTDQLSKRFDQGTLKDPKVVELAQHMVCFRAEAAKKGDGRDLAIKFHVNVLPTVLFLNGEGGLVSEVVGFQAAPDFLGTMQVALDSFKEFSAVKQKLASSPNDGEANAKYATFLSAQQDPTQGSSPVGAPYLEKALATSYRGPYLVRALEAVGDGFAGMQGKEAKALIYYTKALDFAASPAQKCTALIGMMYLQMDSNKAAAKATAQKIIDMKDATPDWVYAAKEALGQMAKG